MKYEESNEKLEFVDFTNNGEIFTTVYKAEGQDVSIESTISFYSRRRNVKKFLDEIQELVFKYER